MRKPMVTRTFKTTKVNVLCLDIVAGEPCNKVVELARPFKDEKKLFAEVEKVINNDTLKAVHIVSKEEVEKLYGMPEQKFLELATELDMETRKELETNAE